MQTPDMSRLRINRFIEAGKPAPEAEVQGQEAQGAERLRQARLWTQALASRTNWQGRPVPVAGAPLPSATKKRKVKK